MIHAARARRTKASYPPLQRTSRQETRSDIESDPTVRETAQTDVAILSLCFSSALHFNLSFCPGCPTSIDQAWVNVLRDVSRRPQPVVPHLHTGTPGLVDTMYKACACLLPSMLGDVSEPGSYSSVRGVIPDQ